MDKHALWYEKYRPQTFDEYVFHDNTLKNAVDRMVNEKTIPHLLFTGVQGSGKSTLSLLLVNAMNVDELDVISINASDENNVDTMRDKIKSFISTYALGAFKIVRLEEADRLTPHAQDILRAMIEEYTDVARFILTANYENKITPPLKSRFQHFRFAKPDRDRAVEFAAQVLVSEKVKFSLEQLDGYVAIGYPDIRKIINLLQQNSFGGKLLPLLEADTADYKFALLDLIETGNWVEARKLACAQVSSEEWEDVYKFLYENLNKSPSFATKDKWEAGIVIIADHLYKHGIVADPEINAAAMFIRLGQI
ncbi:MAG: AAA family ATPase [Thaumarchaeota archaeon]|nr:AAA family ATPase [Nitrososphaerota archaeon]